MENEAGEGQKVETGRREGSERQAAAWHEKGMAAEKGKKHTVIHPWQADMG